MPHESSSPVAHTLDCVSTVTNNHDLETSHRNVGAMVLDIFSAYWNNTERNHCNTTTTGEGFTTMLSDLCGLLKPCGKEFEVLKPHKMMSWTGSSTKCDRLTWWCSLRNVAHNFAVCGSWKGGGKGHEGECDFISLKFFYLTQGSFTAESPGRDFWLFGEKKKKKDCIIKSDRRRRKSLILTKFFIMQKKSFVMNENGDFC